jgi:pyrroline-5-carboxylate reductase
MTGNTIWLIGCGNMAGAMLRGWLAAGEPAKRFAVIDPGNPDLPEDIARHDSIPVDALKNSYVMLGFKPHMLSDIAPGLAPSTGHDTVVLSLLAGVELATLRRAFPDVGQIVRVMPNLPVAHQQGVIGLIAEQSGDDQSHDLTGLMENLGTVDWIADEAVFHAVSALVGSGPAFVYRFIDALAEGGTALGLPAEQARTFAVAMVEGASALAAMSDETPGQLAERVASPGGMTRSGLDVLDADQALAELVGRALFSATERAQEMAREAVS